MSNIKPPFVLEQKHRSKINITINFYNKQVFLIKILTNINKFLFFSTKNIYVLLFLFSKY